MRNALLSLALALPALALGAEGGTAVSTVSLGKQLLGPPVSRDSLQGKVVMIEFWGTH